MSSVYEGISELVLELYCARCYS